MEYYPLAKEYAGDASYIITPTGAIYSKKSGKFLKPWINGKTKPNPYLMVSLGRHHRYYVHQLVLETFRGPCPAGMEACHNDGNSLNNNLWNLRWDTRSNNRKDQVLHGTHPTINGHVHRKVSDDDVVEIRRLGTLGERRKTIAAKFGLTPHYISDIIHHKSR